ncbi:unnamed protein product [Musa acuminata var. zebrina]
MNGALVECGPSMIDLVMKTKKGSEFLNICNQDDECFIIDCGGPA